MYSTQADVKALHIRQTAKQKRMKKKKVSKAAVELADLSESNFFIVIYCPCVRFLVKLAKSTPVG